MVIVNLGLSALDVQFWCLRCVIDLGESWEVDGPSRM